VDWQSRAHFFAVAARIMRRILVDHARAHKKRDPLDTLIVDKLPSGDGGGPTHFSVIDELLDGLAERYPRQARIVEMRFFGGFSEEEIAEALGIAVRTVKRDWRFARAWLYTELTKESHAIKPRTDGLFPFRLFQLVG
jgi:RNA polymerase sigma factor (TIGR02999 family)